ncbi:MAG: penicillin-binding protein 2 [Candidatus Glassbacteria bacterium]|nr:penicillin-binding protein 2 [Candidatus Glassbacteria bacterium]
MSLRSLQEESVSDRLVKAQLSQVFFLVPFLVLLVIFFRHQVLHTSEYSLHSEENRLRRIDLPPPRGLITDRSGRVLAENIPSYSIELYPQPLDSMRTAIKKLSPLVRLSIPQQEQFLEKYRRQRLVPLTVAMDINQKTLAVVEEHRSEFPGIFIRSDMKRSYVYGEQLSHILGYVGEITDKELEQPRYQDYLLGSLIGRSGIEARYEDRLRGERGVKFIEVDARGRELGPFQDRVPVLPKRGRDLQLTIDIRLQQAMYEIMQQVEIGAMIALDPNNGEVLAMLSKPTFDPNLLTVGITGDQWRKLQYHPKKPFINRAVQGTYPPGSTFKPFTALLGIELGYIRGDGSGLEVTCRGGIQYGERYFKCWEHSGHGKVGYHQAIVQSCDTYFYQLGIKIGLEKFCELGRQSGFFEKTGIDLPNEEAGLIPDKDWYNRTYGIGNWGPGNVLNLAIGQGEISVTPLQLACMYAYICTAGKRYRPHMLLDDKEKYQMPPPEIDPARVEWLRAPLTGVVNEPKGTARGSRLWGHTRQMAGKTGTSQNPHGDDHGLFVGFFPADDPEIVAAIVVEHGQHGSTYARLVRDLMLAYIDITESEKTPAGSLAAGYDP